MNQTNQEPCELAEALQNRPLSGEFEEVFFGLDTGSAFWVKFSDKDGVNEWIGKFGGNGIGYITKIAEPDRFFISSGGFAYLVDATSRKLVKQFYKENISEIIYDVLKKSLVATDYVNLQWIDLDGKTIFSKRVAADGIRDLKIEGRILSGLAFRSGNGEEEERFWFDLDKLKILRWEKPWWKFW